MIKLKDFTEKVEKYKKELLMSRITYLMAKKYNEELKRMEKRIEKEVFYSEDNDIIFLKKNTIHEEQEEGLTYGYNK